MESDHALRAKVLERLDTIPDIDPGSLRVHVRRGVVTVAGEVKDAQTRFHVERTILRSPGVQGLATRLGPVRPLLRLPPLVGT